MPKVERLVAVVDGKFADRLFTCFISEKLYSQGKLSKVRHPSKAQVENQFPPIKWTKTERRLK